MVNLKLIFTLILPVASYNMRAQATASHPDSISVDDSTKFEKKLMEIVVKANRKYVKPTGRGIKVSMIGNPVAKLGSASEALRQLPMIDTSKGDIEVLGYGAPQIYINNKLVRNASELSMLPAENIRDVEIITNPSSRYGTDVSSVILIRTKKQDERFHAIATGNGTVSEAFSASGDMNMSCHTESGFTFFGDFSCGSG